MKKILGFLALALICVVPDLVWAQQIVLPCVSIPGTGVSSCAPVTSTNPLPIAVFGGTTGQCLTSNGSPNAATFQACGGSGGSGTVTSVSVTTANGVSGTVATATTTPAITLTLGAITPTTVNGNTLTTGSGTLTIAAGKTLTVSNTLTFTGTDGSSVNFGTGGTVLYSVPTTSTINLGTSAVATNPQRSSQAGTGFYSSTDQVVAVAANGIEAMQWNTVGSGVDYFSMTSGLSGIPPILAIAGSTTNQGFNIVPNGKGTITIGTTVSANSTALVDVEGNQGGSYFGYNFVVNSPSGYGGIGLYQGNTGSSSTKTGDIIVRNFSGNHLEFNSAGEIHMFNSLVVDPIGGFGNNFNGGLGTAFQVISAAGGNAFSVNAVTNGVDGVQITNSIAANPGTATLSAVGSDTNIYLKLLSKGTGTVQIASHKSYLGTAPAVSACGTSPSIDTQATDNSGTVTVGTVAAASCTVTFNVAYTNFVHCRVTSQTTLAAFGYSYTKTAITVTGTSLVGDLFDYECDGQ